MVLGDVTNHGDLELLGWIEGRLIDEDGHSTIAPGAVVGGSPVP
jgi:hypothetical protein